MKQELDREIDALLRRRYGAASSGASHVQTPHLDADELSAYAENALPAATRSLYVAHLGDCDECRRRVVELVRASDVAGELDRRAAPVPVREAASWRAWLGALFAPRTLRFVAPLVAVCFVGIVAFVVMRSNPEGPSVALREGSEPNRQTSVVTGEQGIAEPAISTQTGTTGAPLSEENRSGTSTPAGSAETKPGDGKAPAADAAPTGGTNETQTMATTGGGPAPQENNFATGPVATPAPNDRTGFAAGAAPPPAPRQDNTQRNQPENAPIVEEEVAAVNTQTQNRQIDAAQMRRAQVQAPDGARLETRAGNNVALDSASAGTTASAPSGAAPKREAASRVRSMRSEESKKKDGDEAAETRSVGGHRFRRQGAAWIDVNYKSSMSMTGVARGSDAYRALVADIPEIGRIASSLGGEVIVVVKGRAYRVR